jgi:hypothetical protein
VSLEPASTADPPLLFSLVSQVSAATWQALTGKSCGGSGLRELHNTIVGLTVEALGS